MELTLLAALIGVLFGALCSASEEPGHFSASSQQITVGQIFQGLLQRESAGLIDETTWKLSQSCSEVKTTDFFSKAKEYLTANMDSISPATLTATLALPSVAQAMVSGASCFTEETWKRLWPLGMSYLLSWPDDSSLQAMKSLAWITPQHAEELASQPIDWARHIALLCTLPIESLHVLMVRIPMLLELLPQTQKTMLGALFPKEPALAWLFASSSKLRKDPSRSFSRVLDEAERAKRFDRGLLGNILMVIVETEHGLRDIMHKIGMARKLCMTAEGTPEEPAAVHSFNLLAREAISEAHSIAHARRRLNRIAGNMFSGKRSFLSDLDCRDREIIAASIGILALTPLDFLGKEAYVHIASPEYRLQKESMRDDFLFNLVPNVQDRTYFRVMTLRTLFALEPENLDGSDADLRARFQTYWADPVVVSGTSLSDILHAWQRLAPYLPKGVCTGPIAFRFLELVTPANVQQLKSKELAVILHQMNELDATIGATANFNRIVTALLSGESSVAEWRQSWSLYNLSLTARALLNAEDLPRLLVCLSRMHQLCLITNLKRWRLDGNELISLALQMPEIEHKLCSGYYNVPGPEIELTLSEGLSDPVIENVVFDDNSEETVSLIDIPEEISSAARYISMKTPQLDQVVAARTLPLINDTLTDPQLLDQAVAAETLPLINDTLTESPLLGQVIAAETLPSINDTLTESPPLDQELISENTIPESEEPAIDESSAPKRKKRRKKKSGLSAARIAIARIPDQVKKWKQSTTEFFPHVQTLLAQYDFMSCNEYKGRESSTDWDKALIDQAYQAYYNQKPLDIPSNFCWNRARLVTALHPIFDEFLDVQLHNWEEPLNLLRLAVAKDFSTITAAQISSSAFLKRYVRLEVLPFFWMSAQPETIRALLSERGSGYWMTVTRECQKALGANSLSVSEFPEFFPWTLNGQTKALKPVSASLLVSRLKTNGLTPELLAGTLAYIAASERRMFEILKTVLKKLKNCTDFAQLSGTHAERVKYEISQRLLLREVFSAMRNEAEAKNDQSLFERTDALLTLASVPWPDAWQYGLNFRGVAYLDVDTATVQFNHQCLKDFISEWEPLLSVSFRCVFSFTQSTERLSLQNFAGDEEDIVDIIFNLNKQVKVELYDENICLEFWHNPGTGLIDLLLPLTESLTASGNPCMIGAERAILSSSLHLLLYHSSQEDRKVQLKMMRCLLNRPDIWVNYGSKDVDDIEVASAEVKNAYFCEEGGPTIDNKLKEFVTFVKEKEAITTPVGEYPLIRPSDAALQERLSQSCTKYLSQASLEARNHSKIAWDMWIRLSWARREVSNTLLTLGSALQDRDIELFEKLPYVKQALTLDPGLLSASQQQSLFKTSSGIDWLKENPGILHGLNHYESMTLEKAHAAGYSLEMAASGLPTLDMYNVLLPLLEELNMPTGWCLLWVYSRMLERFSGNGLKHWIHLASFWWFVPQYANACRVYSSGLVASMLRILSDCALVGGDYGPPQLELLLMHGITQELHFLWYFTVRQNMWMIEDQNLREGMHQTMASLLKVEKKMATSLLRIFTPENGSFLSPLSLLRQLAFKTSISNLNHLQSWLKSMDMTFYNPEVFLEYESMATCVRSVFAEKPAWIARFLLVNLIGSDGMHLNPAILANDIAFIAEHLPKSEVSMFIFVLESLNVDLVENWIAGLEDGTKPVVAYTESKLKNIFSEGSKPGQPAKKRSKGNK